MMIKQECFSDSLHTADKQIPFMAITTKGIQSSKTLKIGLKRWTRLKRIPQTPVGKKIECAIKYNLLAENYGTDNKVNIRVWAGAFIDNNGHYLH